ncbi:toxin-activating lysine-acyltransferase [Sinorhizobium sp. NFACC03]|uniref:toxin-activating lysine-acyltransferase n=1 Tax=Sinorhizobium sp. NFACC03 TaxID=1566295 RepID=UPI00088418D6|nr:toxin-activating lysine-acyltransferase [Sinorhizobium sp. NFACC03]SDA87636.1 RTX toxin acyltransferase family protein [Sinorhizobium sp. NFACC03]
MVTKSSADTILDENAVAHINGKGANGVTAEQNLDPALLEKIASLRSKVNETFGKVALAMMATPRYRNLSIADLSHLVLDPLIRDRIAIAQSANPGPTDTGLAGIAIWASVTEEVDARIREQIKAGVFPVRLKSEEWTGGKINWLLDVIAPSPRLATSVLANFKQVLKEGDLRIHPLVSRLVEPEALKKMGASPVEPTSA